MLPLPQCLAQAAACCPSAASPRLHVDLKQQTGADAQVEPEMPVHSHGVREQVGDARDRPEQA